jgi:hypothetical protein
MKTEGSTVLLQLVATAAAVVAAVVEMTAEVAK